MSAKQSSVRHAPKPVPPEENDIPVKWIAIALTALTIFMPVVIPRAWAQQRDYRVLP